MTALVRGALVIEQSMAGAERRLVLRGRIDETSAFSDVAESLAGQVVIDLEGVSFINSIGVREWVRFLRRLRATCEKISFARCSEAMVAQFAAIPDTVTGAQVRSFWAPYTCVQCEEERSLLVDVEPHLAALRRGQPPTFACARCGGTMRIDDLPDRYAALLDGQGRSTGGTR